MRPQLLVVGECLSKSDEDGPFTDGNGKFFKAMLRQSGIEPRQTRFMNVFPRTPPRGAGPLAFFGPQADSRKGVKMLRKKYYIREEYYRHIERCRELVAHADAYLTLCVGEAAMWALTTETSIEASRGRVTNGNHTINKLKCLPILSPRAIQMDWTQRPIFLADLDKARREMDFPEVRRPKHLIYLSPSLEDMEDFYTKHLANATDISCDIETKGEHITCISFAPTSDLALVVPFYTEKKPSGNYWPSHREEIMAWNFVARVLRLPCRLKGQNFQYDMQYLWRFMKIPCPHWSDDTMLLHHALQPEMRKGLGFLGSIYTNEVSWKQMHHVRSDDKSSKKEDL